MDKSILLSLFAALVLLGTTAYFLQNKSTLTQVVYTVDSSSVSPQVKELYDQWKLQYHKKFASPVEDTYRLTVFNDNYHYISTTNSKNNTFVLGINEFMDLTSLEFKTFYLGLVHEKSQNYRFGSNDNRPDSVNWQTAGKVSHIKDQGQCGSCWAFSATGALESCYMIFKNESLEFSEQQLVDCSQSYGNQGCNGGMPDQAFQYVIDHGISTETEYPYRAIDQSCKKSSGEYKISKYTDIPQGNCDDLANAIAQQPVSVGVDATNWQFYQSGVFSDCDKNLDHGVLAIGYKNNQFWIVKNSWGVNWGQQGLIYLAWGDTCGICDSASYPSL